MGIGSQTLFNDMMSSGVLPEVRDHQSDVMNSVGVMELFSENCSPSSPSVISSSHIAAILRIFFRELRMLSVNSKGECIRTQMTVKLGSLQNSENTILLWFGSGLISCSLSRELDFSSLNARCTSRNNLPTTVSCASE